MTGDLFDRLEAERDARGSIRALMAQGVPPLQAAGMMSSQYFDLWYVWQHRGHAGNMQHYTLRYLRADRICKRLVRLHEACRCANSGHLDMLRKHGNCPTCRCGDGS